MIDHMTMPNVLSWIPKSEIISLCTLRLSEVDKLKANHDKQIREFYNEEIVPKIRLKIYFQSILELAEATASEDMLVSAGDYLKLKIEIKNKE